ncbi:biotin synthase BioB [Oxalobacter vibrioformis]|uniref:Biotin synthase n=1 Tax=Oxalobacter vibrioformis TaxID=933080 RepID=A0A9E9P3K5_9BURK|nr:biotin synthase BioB [Oxalobacter vibrioformis]WAW11097.1 biotin synthase BioB [Oxalobacter vibrioformis]
MSQPVIFHKKPAPATLAATATWPTEEVLALFELPFNELLFRAQEIHRTSFPEKDIELATLISLKTGGCTEDCGYCSQSSHHDTDVKASKMLSLDTVLDAAREARANGATRFCMGASGRSPNDRDMEKYEEMVRAVKGLGLETCATLGMLQDDQAKRLKEAGLDYYNHNLDTSPTHYGTIISTHNYQDRLDTLGRVRKAGLKVCCGGIIGMGESRRQRAELISQLANLNPYPESVPINHLVAIEGTPLYGVEALDPLEFVRTIAVARIVMPQARVRMSAGRRELGDTVQALCFLAGANSIFYGDKLLTTENSEAEDDRVLLDKLGLKTKQVTEVKARMPGLKDHDHEHDHHHAHSIL